MRPRIVVAGGGYAGLAALAELVQHRRFEVTLVDSQPAHTLVPELPEALVPGQSISGHMIDFTRLLRDSGVVRVTGEVTGIKAAEHRLSFDSGQVLKFDRVVLSVGTVPAFAPVPGLKQYSRPLRNVRDAQKIKQDLVRRRNLRVVVVGGGLTGVEIAGALCSSQRVSLVEGAPRLLPSLGPGLARYAYRELERARVTFYLNRRLTEVAPDHIVAGETKIPYEVLIWAGGIQAPSWLSNSDLPLDQDGYPVVDGRGRVAQDVYAAGDVWRFNDDGRPLPQTAQLAEQMGRYVGKMIVADLEHAPLPDPLHPHNRGMLVALSPGQGVGWVFNGGIAVRGGRARWLKNFVFKRYRSDLKRQFLRLWPV